MTKDEALDLALEALENVTKDYVESRQYKHNKAITAIKQALAAPVQEPRCAVIVEVFGKDWRLDYMSLPVGKHKLYTQQYVYTTPPAAQPAPVQEPIKPDTLSLEQLLRAAVYWGATYAKGDYHDALEGKIYQWISLRSGATPPAQPAPVPDYAWPTVADYENFMGFEVNEAFRMAWAMARTTNPLFTRVEKNK